MEGKRERKKEIRFVRVSRYEWNESKRRVWGSERSMKKENIFPSLSLLLPFTSFHDGSGGGTHPYEFDYPCKELTEVGEEDEENWNAENGINDGNHLSRYGAGAYVPITYSGMNGAACEIYSIFIRERNMIILREHVCVCVGGKLLSSMIMVAA